MVRDSVETDYPLVQVLVQCLLDWVIVQSLVQ